MTSAFPPLPSSTLSADRVMSLLDQRPVDNQFSATREKKTAFTICTLFVSTLFVLENSLLAALCFRGDFLNETDTGALTTKVLSIALIVLGGWALLYSWKICCRAPNVMPTAAISRPQSVPTPGNESSPTGNEHSSTSQPRTPTNNVTDGETGVLTVPASLFSSVSPPRSPLSLPSFAVAKTPQGHSDKQKSFTPHPRDRLPAF